MDMHSGMSMTSTAAMPASTMSMGGGGGGHGGHGGGTGCKISMLWNWNTIDSCFISSTWRITSRGMFAGSCIGVVLLVMCLEFLRRLGHEYDRYLAGQPSIFSRRLPTGHNTPPKGVAATAGVTVPQPGFAARPRRRTLLEHTLRSLLHMVQFGVAYFVMLLAMYYNGYFIICILIGAFLGSFVFSWQSHLEEKNDACSVTVCCG
uniref:Copper transport protein n=1 Tax=Coccidioides posadasii RMSCC 3488 TaxID=454284 RepID=A0A0J6F107_COCPO|nr:high affinity copper transporter [Coccidioides posadasii RMSCC 3488]